MEPRLSLRCLGEPVLAGPDGEPIRFKVRKHLALLVFLAVEQKGRHHRDFLAELLWANLPERDNRHSLATALSMIRAKVGGDAIEADRDHVRFACMRMDLDLHRLEVGDVLASEFQPALQIAGFLDGFEVPGSAEFMLWRERQRARWLPLVREALVKRIDKCRRTGDFRQIEHLADRMLHLDELSEEAVRAKMEARAFAGDRLTALKVFEAWKDRLDEDLGASPSALVEGMAIRLRQRGWERPGSSPIPAVHTDQWKNRPFVGRANEYQALYEAWERTRRREPGHAILVGDSGIGKTTLADRLATAAGLEGAVTSRVQCYELEREIPYATVSGLVHGLLDKPGASATPPEALAELSRTVPEVRLKFPTIPPPGDSQGETARILLTEAFHQLLSALADEQPVALIVDDLHLADDASLAVLHLMMRRARGQPIMVVFATRGEGLDQSPQASRLRESAERLGIRTIELGRMSDEESSELLTSFIPAGEEQPGLAARRALLRAAAGYPMVLELLVQDWQANGERSLALSVEAMTKEPPSSRGSNESYRIILDRITTALDPATRNVLNLASILGRRLNDLDYYGLASLSIGESMSGMATLVQIRLLRERGDGLEFVNELIRAHVYLNIPSPLRRAIHGQIAGRLLSDARLGSSRSGLEVAWHCFRGGREPDGIPYLLCGARDAIRDGAPHEVELALSSALSSLSGVQRDQAKLLLVEAFQEQGRCLDSRIIVSELRSAGYVSTDRLLDVLDLTARHRAGDIGSDNAEHALFALEEIVGSSTDPSVSARALTIAALIVDDTQNRRFAPRLHGLLEQLDPSTLDEASTLRLLMARSILCYWTGRRDSARVELLDAVARLRTTTVANLAAVQLVHCSSAMNCSAGAYALALEDASFAQRMAVRLGNDLASATAAANLALCHGRLGAYEDQVRWASWGEQLLGPTFTGHRDIQLGFARAFGNAMVLQEDPALAAVSKVDLRIAGVAPEWMRQGWQLQRADVLQLLGRNREALAQVGQLVASGNTPASSFAGAFARWTVLVAIAVGEPQRAQAPLKKLKSQLTSYDAVDQAEILASSWWLRSQPGMRTSAAELRHLRNQLSQLLGNMPPAVSNQLARLGVLALSA